MAVRVAQENIELNPGMENIHVAAGDLLKGVEIESDVIVANILADILIHLTDDAIAVSYTHLDVYKRQALRCLKGCHRMDLRIWIGQADIFVGNDRQATG